MPVSETTRITSRQHAVVRQFRQVAGGDDLNLVLLDGEHLLAEAMAAGIHIDLVLTDGRAGTIAGRARAAGASVYEGSTSVLEAASPVRTPSGVVSLATWRLAPMVDVIGAEHACGLALAGVQDPGNVGSAIRAADALGATGVLALEGTASPRGWKTLRGAMGSSFRVPIGAGSAADAMTHAHRHGQRVVAAVASGGVPIDRADLRTPLLLMIGSEGAGLAPDLLANADQRVTVPMRTGVDSLNVAVTAALILFEARRQRLAP